MLRDAPHKLYIVSLNNIGERTFPCDQKKYARIIFKTFGNRHNQIRPFSLRKTVQKKDNLFFVIKTKLSAGILFPPPPLGISFNINPIWQYMDPVPPQAISFNIRRFKAFCARYKLGTPHRQTEEKFLRATPAIQPRHPAIPVKTPPKQRRKNSTYKRVMRPK